MLTGSKPETPALTRRGVLKALCVTGLAGLSMILLAEGGKAYAKRLEPVWLEISHKRLKLPRLPKSFSGFRLVQISDLHLGSWMTAQRAVDLLKTVRGLSPDAVAMTGDFVMGYGKGRRVSEKLEELVPALKELTRQAPVFGVLGNHDYKYDSDAVSNLLHQGGAEHLNNSVSILRRGNDTLSFSGVDDVLEGDARLENVTKCLPPAGCSVLLAHEPDFADQSSATGLFDLQISGHSHGGQVVVPLWGPPILPEMAEKYPSGLYRVGNMLQYTNRGVGMTYPFFRFNCRPEITVFILERGVEENRNRGRRAVFPVLPVSALLRNPYYRNQTATV